MESTKTWDGWRRQKGPHAAWSPGTYPQLLRESYDSPPLLHVEGNADLSESPRNLDRWDASSHPLGESNGRAVGARSGRSRPGNRQRFGARNRRLRPQRSAPLGASDHPQAFLAAASMLSIRRRTERFLRKSSGEGRLYLSSPWERFPRPGISPFATDCGDGARSCGSRGSAVFWVVDHPEAGAMESGREVFAVPGNVTQAHSLRPESVDQTGREARGSWKDGIKGAADAHSRRAAARRDNGWRPARIVGGAEFGTGGEGALRYARSLERPARRRFDRAIGAQFFRSSLVAL